MKIQDVMQHLQNGEGIRRVSWDGFIKIIQIDSHKVLGFVRPDGKLVQVNPIVILEDIMADDWQIE